MNCPRCSSHATWMGTFDGAYGTQRRAYICVQRHRFHTVEVIEPPGAVARHQLSRAMRAAAEANRTRVGA